MGPVSDASRLPVSANQPRAPPHRCIATPASCGNSRKSRGKPGTVSTQVRRALPPKRHSGQPLDMERLAPSGPLSGSDARCRHRPTFRSHTTVSSMPDEFDRHSKKQESHPDCCINRKVRCYPDRAESRLRESPSSRESGNLLQSRKSMVSRLRGNDGTRRPLARAACPHWQGT